MTTDRERIEYIDFKLDDEGLEGVAEHAMDFVADLDPELEAKIARWWSNGDSLTAELRTLVADHIGDTDD